MTVDEDLRIVVSRRLKSAAANAELSCSMKEAEGRRLVLPKRFPAAADALEHHRQKVFRH
jgi:predicted restriction endonuclease